MEAGTSHLLNISWGISIIIFLTKFLTVAMPHSFFTVFNTISTHWKVATFQVLKMSENCVKNVRNWCPRFPYKVLYICNLLNFKCYSDINIVAVCCCVNYNHSIWIKYSIMYQYNYVILFIWIISHRLSGALYYMLYIFSCFRICECLSFSWLIEL